MQTDGRSPGGSNYPTTSRDSDFYATAYRSSQSSLKTAETEVNQVIVVGHGSSGPWGRPPCPLNSTLLQESSVDGVESMRYVSHAHVDFAVAAQGRVVPQRLIVGSHSCEPWGPHTTLTTHLRESSWVDGVESTLMSVSRRSLHRTLASKLVNCPLPQPPSEVNSHVQ